MMNAFDPANPERENGKKKKWDEKDIEVLRLVVLLASVNPSEERLEWVFNEVRTIARMVKEEKEKRL